MSRQPQLSTGALELLHIAIENDRRQALARNAMLAAALRVGEEVLSACRVSDSQLTEWLGTEPPPRHFLGLTAAILQRVRKEAVQDSASQGMAVATDFDRHVLQGLAAALADVAWPERAAEDFDGPAREECRRRFAAVEVLHLWEMTLHQYMANILQHYFSAARIRQNVRGLPPETEDNLRRIDALTLARHAAERGAQPGNQPVTPHAMMAALGASLRAALGGD